MLPQLRRSLLTLVWRKILDHIRSYTIMFDSIGCYTILFASIRFYTTYSSIFDSIRFYLIILESREVRSEIFRLLPRASRATAPFILYRGHSYYVEEQFLVYLREPPAQRTHSYYIEAFHIMSKQKKNVYLRGPHGRPPSLKYEWDHGTTATSAEAGREVLV